MKENSKPIYVKIGSIKANATTELVVDLLTANKSLCNSFLKLIIIIKQSNANNFTKLMFAIMDLNVIFNMIREAWTRFKLLKFTQKD